MPADDSLMNRFDRNGLRRFRARDGILALLVCAALLVVFKGDSLERQGERMDPGVARDHVLAVGRPAGTIADALPVADAADDATAFLSPDDKLSGAGSFTAVSQGTGAEVPPVTPEAFDPVSIGARPPARRPLKNLLVTGDSMSQPLDAKLAGALAGRGVKVTRDPHLGTGISKSFLVDWGELSTEQVKKFNPDAIVVFIGANEGFPMEGAGGKETECCGADWAALYANRVRRMVATYRQNGDARVYWITVPTARAANRAPITRVVNAAVGVAVQPWASQVRLVDTNPIFAPKGYRDSMPVDGRDRIVRAADGIHLNEEGAQVLSETVLARLGEDFTY
jgi:lysophospholipase L1-like esterase